MVFYYTLSHSRDILSFKTIIKSNTDKKLKKARLMVICQTTKLLDNLFQKVQNSMFRRACLKRRHVYVAAWPRGQYEFWLKCLPLSTTEAAAARSKPTNIHKNDDVTKHKQKAELPCNKALSIGLLLYSHQHRGFLLSRFLKAIQRNSLVYEKLKITKQFKTHRKVFHGDYFILVKTKTQGHIMLKNYQIGPLGPPLWII